MAVAACALGVTVLRGNVRAASLSVSLDYQASPGCLDEGAFKDVVVGWLGYDPFDLAAGDRVLVRIETSGDLASGHIEWRDSAGRWAGEQVFPDTNASCRQLARSAGFALAVQIRLLAKRRAGSEAGAPRSEVPNKPADSSGASDGPSQGERPVSPGENERAREAERATEERPTPEPRPSPTVVSTRPGGAPPSGRQLAIGAGSFVGVGLSSSAMLFGRLFGSVAWPRLSLELSAAASLPTTTRRADGAGFSQRDLMAGAAVCAASHRLNACLLANLANIRLAGVDIAHPASVSAWVAQTGARIAVVQPLGARFFLAGRAEALVVLTRGVARLDQSPVWTSPRFAATLGLDAGVRFP